MRGFLFELIELGYSWTAQCSRLRLMGELSSWMALRGIEPEDLTQSLLDEFLQRVRTSDPRARWCSPSSERQLLGYFRGLGALPEPETPALTAPLDLLVADFDEYLMRRARPGGGFEHRPGLPADCTAVLVRAGRSRWWR